MSKNSHTYYPQPNSTKPEHQPASNFDHNAFILSQAAFGNTHKAAQEARHAKKLARNQQWRAERSELERLGPARARAAVARMADQAQLDRAAVKRERKQRKERKTREQTVEIGRVVEDGEADGVVKCEGWKMEKAQRPELKRGTSEVLERMGLEVRDEDWDVEAEEEKEKKFDWGDGPCGELVLENPEEEDGDAQLERDL